MIETGKILQQRYRIDKQIGQGGMGAVYVATDERFGSTVAIKETLCMDDNYRKAIEREARLLNSLKHGALPRVTDHFLEEEGQFLVMEFIPGEDLFTILEERGEPFPADTVIDWADQLLDALEFLHTQSMPVIHRDIKPQNLKVTPKGRIVLLDFGLAKGNPTDAGVQTAAKSIFGYSRNYASLEQIQGTGTDPRSDLYSLAATLYHLITGQTPEDALTRAMAVLNKLPDPLVPANSIRADVPAGFAGILQKAMDLNAGLRPGSAGEMRAMLKEMDAYAHYADDASSAATVANVDIGSQKTRLMPGVTNQVAGGQASVPTEVLPAYISQETAVRTSNPGEIAAKGGGRNFRRRIAYAGGAALALTGVLVGGALMFSPTHDATPASAEETPAAPQQQLTTTSETAPASNIAGTEPSAVPGTAPAPKPQSAKPDGSVQARQNSKSSPAGSGTSANSSVSDGASLFDDDPELKGKTIYIGNLKIKDGKIETPKVVVGENGLSPRSPSPPPVIGPDGLPDPRYMTPAQRRKLQELRRRGIFPPARNPNRPRTENKP